MEQPSPNGVVDSEQPPAFQSLRNKFEQLSLDQSTQSHHRRTSGGQGDLLTPNALASPRPRTPSNGRSRTPSDASASVSGSTRIHSSSSSSDIRSLTKRPPPPPPPSRGPKAFSGSPTIVSVPSPLLRPVPVPAVNGTSGTSSSSSYESPTHEYQPETVTLKNKFDVVPPASPRQTPYLASTSAISLNKPSIPPRSSKSSGTSIHKPRLSYSSESLSGSSTTPSLRTISPFSDEDDSDFASSALVPPKHPARKQRVHASSTHSSESSFTTSENDANGASLPTAPRPPSRFRTTTPTASDSSISSTGPSTVPPPLPTRRATITQAEETNTSNSSSPRLPTRPQVVFPGHGTSPDSPVATSSSLNERKAVGPSRHPPPPTRTIAPGGKLPPPRRPPSPSSEEESDEEEVVDMMPDCSRTSRRPPVLSFREGYTESNIFVHAHSGTCSVAGITAVVAYHHTIKIYDLAKPDSLAFSLEMKDLVGKEYKVTAMENRPSANRENRGFVLWIGTKEGHLFELDARAGFIISSKYSSHLHSISHIFRHGRSMVTLDHSGKCLIFSPDATGEDISLTHTQPRVVRIAEKQDFVKIIAGKMWTASRADHQVLTGALKVPVIRVYDIFAPGNPTRQILPTEPVGVVTSAAIISSQPGLVYVGHEGGTVSLWTLETQDGYPAFVEVMRVGFSDVMTLESANDRLWTGARSGLISVFDVSHKPWVMTNAWNPHPGLPVLRMTVDHYGIDKIGRLCVFSVGRDEQLRLWDGLLGLDWVDEELFKQEHLFTQTRSLKVLLVSWNCDAARPESLTGDLANVNFLSDVLRSVNSPDIISFGFQEVIDLESRKMAAKNVILGNSLGSSSSKKTANDGGLSDRVTGAYRRWYDRLVMAVRQNMPSTEPYIVVHSESLVGLFSCIFVKTAERESLREAEITAIKRGMGGRYGNKGGITSRFMIDDSSICFINCHLAAGQNAVRQRNADVTAILEGPALFEPTHYPFAYVGGGDGQMVLDHEIVFVNGDMNYRIDHRREAIMTAVQSNDINSLYAHDQLLREIKFNRACRFRGFSEGALTFLPTYKYDPRTDEYDTSEKRRSPAWCDRILWRSRISSRVTQLHYKRYEANVSDHRPISSAFTVTVKSIEHEVRQQVKTTVQSSWVNEQRRLLTLAKQFYVRQALI